MQKAVTGNLYGVLTANNEGVKSRFGHGWSRIVTTLDHPDSIHLFSEKNEKKQKF